MKKIDSIKLDEVPGFGKLLKAYLAGGNDLPSSDYFDKVSLGKQLDFRKKFEHRDLLNTVLNQQNKSITLSETTRKNIELLKKANTVCVTTGHQLALMSGPLFVTYKILTTIKLANEYSKLFPETNFVPVFWLASEDHDKAEIDHFSIHGKDFHWETEQTGAVGEFNCDGILALVEKIENEINGLDKNLISILKKAYSLPNLSDTTRFLLNELFGEFGLVIVDGNDTELKKLMAPVVEKEINEKIVFNNVSKANSKLISAGFEPAINPRELNLFLLTQNDRKRLEFTSEGIKTVDDSLKWTKNEFLEFANKNPEKISPNVLMRPVYQETVLPNIAYVGGPAETEYWLQLDELFLACGLQTPQRVLRICNTLISEKNVAVLEKTGLRIDDLFTTEDELTKKIVAVFGGNNLDFSSEKEDLGDIFDLLAIKAKQIDATLEGAVNAEHARQEKALENLLSKLVKAEKVKQENSINKILKIRNVILPNGKPQERSLTLLEVNGFELKEFFGFLLGDGELDGMNIFVG